MLKETASVGKPPTDAVLICVVVHFYGYIILETEILIEL